MRREARHEQDRGPYRAVSGTETAVACVICDGPVPPGSKYERKACDNPECRSAYNAWCVSRSPTVRRARAEALTGERECSDCGGTFPLDLDHFPSTGKRGGRTLMRRQCRPCWRKRGAEHKRRLWERIKADPERHARQLEADRIRHALKRERETGEFPSRHRRSAKNAHREDMGQYAALMAPAPVTAWLDVVIARELPDYGVAVDIRYRGRTLEDLAGELGVAPRRLWSLVHGRQEHVAFSTVDKFVTNYPKTVTGEEMAAALEARCRAMPGNGERLLRYMDAAEEFAHLCDRAVWRAADLYPEMAS